MSESQPRDRLNRPLRDLRISVTDRCNFRCDYCMPASRSYRFLPRNQLLSFEEIATVARIFAAMGVRKLRLTGGEPLLRQDLAILVGMLAEIEGIADIALTTNGFLLAGQAVALKRAGLTRVTVSFDSLDAATFARLCGRDVAPQLVLDAMQAASDAGLPVKVNMVVQKGINDGEICAMAELFRRRGHVLRFIEFMDVGNVNAWEADNVVTGRQILDRLSAVLPCEPLDAQYRGEVARRYRYLDGQGEFGLITSVSQPFCGGCSRARLSAEGDLYTCLFAGKGHDLKRILREEGSDVLAQQLRTIWQAREDRYSELRGQVAQQEKVEMFKIGG